jgi:hypothetical protein
MAAIGHALEMDSDKAARLLPVTKPVWRHHHMGKATAKQIIRLVRDDMAIGNQLAGKTKYSSKTACMGKTTTIRKNRKDNGDA